MRIKRFLFFLITALCAASCHDKFLEEDAYSFLTPSNFYKNSKDAQAAVNAVYRKFYENENNYYGYNLLALAELPTNAVTSVLHDKSVDHGRLDIWRVMPGDEGSIYGTTFQIINRANAVLDNVPPIPMDETLKNRILGEARFLRALAYFNGVRIYGDLPVLTSVTREQDIPDLAIPADPASEVYRQIIEDLNFAKANLPSVATYGANDKGRAGRSSAKTLLAKVYLTRASDPQLVQAGDYQAAAELLREVIDDGDHVLLDSYAALWNYETNENNKEIIFDLQLTRIAGLGGRLTQQLATTNTGSTFANSFATMNAEIDFYKSYQPGDTRLDVTFDNSFVKGNQTIKFDPEDPRANGFPQDTPGFRKNVDFSKTARLGQEEPNFVVLRYADVLLMLAEALNEVNQGPTEEAYEAINQVRRRAFGKNIQTPDAEVDLSGLDYESFRVALLDERQKELVMEGHGWFDGMRFYDIFLDKVAQASIGGNPAKSDRPKEEIDRTRIEDPKYRHFPIPPDAIQRNPQIKQPAGW